MTLSYPEVQRLINSLRWHIVSTFAPYYCLNTAGLSVLTYLWLFNGVSYDNLILSFELIGEHIIFLNISLAGCDTLFYFSI